jgi:hypothetical protein
MSAIDVTHVHYFSKTLGSDGCLGRDWVRCLQFLRYVLGKLAKIGSFSSKWEPIMFT